MQEQLHEREQAIHDLERRMEEKGRELIAIKRDNEAVCGPFSFSSTFISRLVSSHHS